MQRIESERRQISAECPTCGIAHSVTAPRDVAGEPVVTTRRALSGAFTREECSSGHRFFVYYC